MCEHIHLSHTSCAQRPKLKVILMSATLDTARFAAYFSGLPGLGGKDGQTPILHIPGRTFPVRDLYLEDALSFTGHRPRLKRRVKKKKKTKGESGAGEVVGDVQHEVLMHIYLCVHYAVRCCNGGSA